MIRKRVFLYLIRLDQWLLDRVEGASRAVESLTGFDCFDQERMVYAVITGITVYMFVTALSGLSIAVPLWARVLFGVTGLVFTYGWLRRACYDSDTVDVLREIAARGFINPARLVLAWPRLIVTGLAFLMIAAFHYLPHVIYWVALWLSTYLHSCTPRPPQPEPHLKLVEEMS